MSDLIVNRHGDTLRKPAPKTGTPEHLFKLQVRVNGDPVAEALGFHKYLGVLVTLPGGIETNVLKSRSDARMALTLQKCLPKFYGAKFRIVRYRFSEVPRDEIYIKVPESSQEPT